MTRPNRQERRRNGKSDDLDAIEAARAALSGGRRGSRSPRIGNVEAIRVLLIAQRSARTARIKCLNQIRHLGSPRPTSCENVRDVSRPRLARTARALRPTARGSGHVRDEARSADAGRRAAASELDTDELSTPRSTSSCAPTAPDLLDVSGVGIDTAAILLVAAGDNPERSDPKPRSRTCVASHRSQRSSAKTVRHRLNRGGNRQANHALWRIVFTRMSTANRAPAPTSRAASSKDDRNPRSCASSSVTSPARSTTPPRDEPSLGDGTGPITA